jgi:hypothetical protein
MKVMVSGSLRGVADQRKEDVRAAARELGKCIGAAGHTVLVGTADADDVDPYVVEGFLSIGKTAQAEVHLMKGASMCYAKGSNVKPRWHRYDDWDVTVLEVVRYDSDAVIVMAGRQGVVQAGIAGWMLGRPTIPVGGFGGGAEKVWNYASSDRQRFYFGALTDREIDQLNSPWESDVTGAKIVKHLERCAEYARRAAISPALRIGVSIGILLALIAWVLLLALPLLGWPSQPAATTAGSAPVLEETSNGIRFLLLLAAVCSAGVFGALVQSMRGIRDGMVVTGQKASVDAVLGLAAGFLTAALYMLAQIAITGKLDLPVSNPDYSRVALVVSMAAVFASLYLDSAFSRFDGFKESVMSGTYGKKSSDG